MNLDRYLHRIACLRCVWTEVWGPEEMSRRLRAAGQLRRAKETAPELTVELFRSLLAQLHCPDCGSTELDFGPLTDSRWAKRGWGHDDDDWPEVRLCVGCRQPIAAERLELFPDMKRCAACQESAGADDHGEVTSDDFCPRCGSLLTVRTSQGLGLTRYQAVCPSCGFRS